MTTREYRNPVITPVRIHALVDGVFAIAMTILVFELSVPIVTGTSVNSELILRLLQMWPSFLIYLLSFLALGAFWLMHHSIYDTFSKYDVSSAWINIFLLMFIALIPFSTSLFVEYRAQQITALIYGVNLFVIFSTLTLLWSYGTSNHRLLDVDIDYRLLRGAKKMGVIYSSVNLLAIGISFINPAVSFIIYGTIIGAFFVFTMIGRAELVMVWRGTQIKDQETTSISCGK